MFNTVSSLAAWLLAVVLALALAFASPTESNVMGRFGPFESQSLTNQSVRVPDGLPHERTLALVTFKRDHWEQAESWIRGMDLRNDPSIFWLRMALINDPGTGPGRHEIKERLLGYYPKEAERARLVPAFVDRPTYTRLAGLSNTTKAYAVVLNRRGDVLARAEGAYSPEKARVLLETLRDSDQ